MAEELVSTHGVVLVLVAVLAVAGLLIVGRRRLGVSRLLVVGGSWLVVVAGRGLVGVVVGSGGLVRGGGGLVRRCRGVAGALVVVVLRCFVFRLVFRFVSILFVRRSRGICGPICWDDVGSGGTDGGGRDEKGGKLYSKKDRPTSTVFAVSQTMTVTLLFRSNRSLRV